MKKPFHKSQFSINQGSHLNPFVPSAPFLYPPKTSENLGCMGKNGLRRKAFQGYFSENRRKLPLFHFKVIESYLKFEWQVKSASFARKNLLSPKNAVVS